MMALVDRALALNPNFARGWHISGNIRMWAGQPDIAITHAEAALRLSPGARVGASLVVIGAAHCAARRFDEAVPKLLLAIQEDPSHPVPYRFLAACYAHMGRLAETREIVARLRAIGVAVIPDVRHHRDDQHRELILSGLRLAIGEEDGVMAVPPRVDGPGDLVPSHSREAERRQITALCCELVSGAPGGDGVALEDLREVVGDFQRCVSETADRHQGFVYRELGNNALVLFGYPEAHELDAEQAIRAGLELCAMVGSLGSEADAPVRCRIGIATGMVIVGDPVGVGAARGEGIVGDAPNLASRLAVSTQPGTVTIDPATRRLTGDLFDCRELGAIEAAGSTEPIRSWQVLGESRVESRFEALRGPALTPLVGRDDEIDLLLLRWARAKTGDGQLMLVSGEPGIGKSRIAAALEERLGGEPHLRLRYFCSPYHQNSALFPFVEQLAHAAGFARDDTPAAKWEKLEALLAGAATPDEDVALLADLLSLPASERRPLPRLSPQPKKDRTLAALIREIVGLACRQPVVMLFEDAHWIDPTSRELLDLMIERIRSLPVLLIRDVPSRVRAALDRPGASQLAGAQPVGSARSDRLGGADRRQGVAQRGRRRDRRAHRRRAAVHRGIDQERCGERVAARRGGPLGTRSRAAAIRDPDDFTCIIVGAARPPGLGAAGGADRRGDRTPVSLCAVAHRLSPFRGRTASNSCTPRRLRAGIPTRHTARRGLHVQTRPGAGRGARYSAARCPTAIARADRRSAQSRFPRIVGQPTRVARPTLR